MVDFEGGKRGGFDTENGSSESFDAVSNEYQEAPVSYSPGTRFLVPDANGVVVLPEGASLEDVTLQGGDLVITLADGSTFVFPDSVYVLPDGTIFVPQIVSEGVALDPTDVTEFLNPEGPGLPQLPTRSSGGNFEEDPGNIQNAFDLGDLLPYTELSRTIEEDEEILPFDNQEPEVVIETLDNPVGVENAIATVNEDGLPERGGEVTEPEGTADETDSETTTGTIRISSPDGIAAVLINGEEVTSVGQDFVSPYGTLTITSIDLDSGVIGVSYTLDDNLLGETVDGFYSVTVLDADGDQATASLSIIVVDDAPIAINDSNTVPGGTHDPIMGNVVDNDESGADGFPVGGAVTGFSNEAGSGDPSDTLQGDYGTLTLNADGSYTYTRDFNTPGGVQDSFEYTIVDQDGSETSATLTIDIEDAPDTIEIPEIGDGTVVNEGGLPQRDDEPAGTGEIADNDPTNNSDPSESTGATVTFNSPDGVESVTVNGVAIDPDGLPQTIADDETGTLVITDYTYDPVTGDGTITYDYTLGDNTSGDDTSVSFEFVVTDLDGDEASDDLVITIVDDAPEAIDDSATQAAENAPITVDAFANDIEGADGVELTAIAAVDGTLSGGGDLVYNDDGTFTYTPTPGEEGTVTFDYTITDGDGDVSTATVTIDLLPDSTPEIFVEGGDTVDEAGLPARGDEPAGSDEAADSETTSGVIVLDTGNDTVGSLVINGTDVTNGGTVTTDKGVLTVTLTDGEYSYSYELTDNTLSDPDTDAFELVVTDSDGDTASTDLVINIVDDTPTAVDDADSLSEGGPVSTAGNVITDAEANGDNGADTPGADGASVQNAGTIAGTYGDLVLGADGSYTYTLSAFGISQLETLSDGEFFTEVFDYTLVDGDGDTDDATLTITLNGEDDIVTVNGLDNEAPEVSLDEDDLANVGDDQGSDQSDPLFQNGSFGVTSPDGLDDVQVNGVDVVVDGVFTAVEVANDGVYSVEVTGWTPVFAADGTTVISATFDYTATLLDNTLAHTGLDDAALVEMLNVTADDVDGSSDSAVLDVEIVDDTPTAVDDADSLSEGGPVSTAGNVITDAEANGDNGADTPGADGASVQNAGTIAGTYGDLVLGADGSYTYTLSAFGISQLETLSDGEFFTEVFDYTLVDGDGDTDDATLTITLNGEDDIVTVNGLDNEAPEVSLDEDDLANVGDDQGSDQSDPLFQNGSFGVTSPDGLDDVQVNGVDVVVDGVFTAVEVANDGVYSVEVTGWTPVFAADGTTVISATFDYTATLLDNTLAHTGLDDAALVEMLNVTADDVDGSSDSAVLDVEIVDDTPDATDNTNTVTEGGSVGGNVVTDDDGNGVDISGADGYATDGAVVSIRTQDGLTVDATPDGAGNYTVATALGTLTINQDGTYTYASNANTTDTNVADTFIYTIRDGDGDESEAELVIDIENVAGQVSDNDVDVDEKGLIDGTGELADGDANNQSDQSEVDSDGQITVVGATGTFVYTLTGANSDGDGAYGTLVLNSATGEYTYTLDTEFDHDAGNGRNVKNAAESFTYIVKDSLGNEIGTGSIDVNITDDIPTIVVDNSGTAPDELVTQDADTVGVAFDTATSDFTGAFTVSTEMFGADGPGTSGVTYAMTLTAAPGADSGLDSDGADIFLYQLADGTVVGSTAGVAPATAGDASVVFSIAVDANSGLVTLTQNDEIDHALPGDTSNYDVQLAELGSGLVGVTATGSITDNDGDTDSESEMVDLGGLVQFADDGPTIDASVTDGNTVKLVTQDAETDGDPTDTDTATSTANFGGAFTIASSDFGADGPGTIEWDFSLSINNGVSGLSSDGDPITLFEIGGKVVGSTATLIGDVDASNTIFDIAVAANGAVTLTQYEELDHPANGDTSAPYDDQLLSLADGLVNLDGKATITDGDGDVDSETVSLDLGGNIQFADDGPSINDAVLGSSVDVDETDGLTTSDTSAASIISFTSAFGADGAGTTAYAISIADANSGLATAVGDLPITLVQTSATTIEGQYNGGANTAFTITINADGTITLEQATALEHLVDGSDPVVDHNDVLDLAGKINATVTVTDGDGDSASETVAIGPALQFLDDGPSAALSGVTDGLAVSDADFSSDDSEDFSDAFTFDGGEDGTASTAFVLGATNGSDSGLVDTATGNSVFLFLEGGEVVGREGIDAVDAATGAEVFTVSVTTGGTVELDQSRAVDHALSTGSDGSSVTLASDGLIQLTGTVTDNDGDTASETLDIGSNLTFTDDVPTAGANGTVQIDDDALGGNAGGTGDDADATNTTGTLSHDFGNDGGSIAFNLTGAPSAEFQYVTDGSDGVLIQQDQGSGFVTVVTVTLDTATGDYTVTQNANILHADGNDENNVEFTLGYTVTDGDTDTATSSIVINVDDDTPTANDVDSTGTVDEDGLAGGIADNGSNDVLGADTEATGSVTSLFNAGADAPLTFSLDDSTTAALDALNLTSNDVTVTYSIVGDTITATAGATSIFTFTLNDPATGDWKFVLEGPLDHADTDDSENAVDIDIDFGSLIQATDADGDTIDATGSVIVTIDDDTPRANDDTDSLSEDDASTDGNVVLGTGTDSGLAGEDESGADGFADPIVTAITGFGGIGAVDGNTTGEHGTLAINADGTYIYTLTNAALQGMDDGEFETDTFTYTIEDADGDAVTATLEITINGVNDAPVANADTNFIIEDGSSPITGNVLEDEAHNGAPDNVNRGDVADTDVDGEDLDVAAADAGTITGTYGILTLDAETGEYSYRLYELGEGQDAAVAAVQALDENDAPLADVFNYNATDGTTESNETSLTISIFGTNDAPVVTAATAATSDEGLVGGNTDTSGNPTDTTDLASDSGTLVITDVDDSTFSITLGEPGPGLSSGGEPITWLLSNGDQTLTGSTASNGAVITVAIDDVGNWTVNQLQQIDHADAASEDVTSFIAPVFVSDGTVTTPSTITVSLEDDSPIAVTADDLAATNAAGVYMDDLNGGADVDANYGGDGGRVIFTQNSIDTLVAQSLTSGLAALDYSISTDGTVLTAVKTGTTDTVFTITLDPDSADDMYVLDLVQPLDAVTDISFSDGGYDFLGGNGAWAGFNQPTNPDSLDLILTPSIGGVDDGTINSSDISGGVGSGNSLGEDETLRVDFVNNLTGDPSGAGGYSDPANQDHTFDSNVATNGASALFTSSSGTELKIEAFDDTGGNNDVGDGDHDDITGIDISNNGMDSGLLTSDGTVNVGGDSYTVTFNNDGTVNVTGVNGSSGAQATGTRIAVFTDQQGLDGGETIVGYTTLEFTYVSGDTVKVGDFGATQQSDEPVVFNVPISVIDNDGDIVASDDLDITLNPAVTPVVLDLDGGGNAFSSLSAGIAYDYSGDGVKTQTAWVAAGSAILAYDLNGDGIVTDASEFVFGTDGQTDLEALATNYDTNQDGVLDISDSTYGKFGVWIDADLDGVSDDGEFVTLTDAGISSIELISDGIVYQAGEGDVTVFGNASFTRDDGSIGEVADAAFVTGTDVGADMEALLALSDDSEVPVELADVSGLRGDQGIADITVAIEEIVNDIMAEGVVDSMIEHFAGEVTGFIGETGYLSDNALAQSIDGGAFTFGASTVADMTEDAAAMVAMHA